MATANSQSTRQSVSVKEKLSGACLSLSDLQQILFQACAVRQGSRALKQSMQQTRGQLTRPQFIEVLLRTALARRGQELSTVAVLERFVEDVIQTRIMQPPIAPYPRGLLLQVRRANLPQASMSVKLVILRTF